MSPFSTRRDGRRVAARFVSLALLCTLVAAVVGTGIGVAQDGPPAVEDDVRGFGIDPPGQCGHINQDSSECDHYEDQLEMYASLVNDEDVTEGELEKLFKPMDFGPGDDFDDPYEPVEGATVYRDTAFGVPHIYADSLTNASFALGYVSAEDRLWEMDIFRHAARGTLTEFIGNDSDDTYLNMDIATRREGYTEEEIQTMFDELDDKFGQVGKDVQEGLQAYSDGINAYIDEAKVNPAQLPFEYTATQNPPPVYPEEWSPADTLYLVVLQLRVFGETAGDELQNAGLYAFLTKKFGKKLGRKAYNDFAFQNDPKSPTSIAKSDANFNTQSVGKIKWSSVAMPDGAEDLAEETLAEQRAVSRGLASLGFRSPVSNALIVSREESKSGNPLQIGAPQVGYATPGFFMEIDVHAPGLDFRGPAVPGASALIPLGRGRDYAWTLTTGFSDAVDTRVELLCEPGGGEATVDSNGYMFNGECKEMTSREETFTIKPTAANPGPPGQETHTFYRTEHGPVFVRGAVDGKPVAFVKERFFWMKELDSVPQFARWNYEVDDIDDFADAAEDFTMSFNAFYADAENIGYFHVGHYPKRVRGQHPSLPTWGTGEWEWQGRRPFSQQPHILNPDTGWIANWNNKPTAGWRNFDSAKWGSIQRVKLLQDQMHDLLDGDGQARLSDLVDVIGRAATQDPRGLYLGPKMVKWAGKTEGDETWQTALRFVRKWIADGAHRENGDNDDNMEQGPALAIFDEWYDQLVHKVYDDELGGGYDLLMSPITDYDPAGGSSFFFDMSSYLKNLFNRRSARRLAMNYCDDQGTNAKESCKLQVTKALEDALKKLKQDQGNNPADWTMPREDIVFQEFGFGSVDPIPWQNRGTHNHATEILRDSGPIQENPSPSGSGSPSPTES